MATDQSFAAFADCIDLSVFDAAQALHWYCVDYHEGQWSDLYALQCSLGYRPGASESGCEDNNAAWEVYNALIRKDLDPFDMKEWINSQLNRTKGNS